MGVNPENYPFTGEYSSILSWHLGELLATDSMNRERQTAENTKPLSTAERKALVAEMAKTASPRARRGLAMIDFREPTPKERAIGDSLVESARRARARNRESKAA